MTLVAVSQRVDAYPERNEWRDAIDGRLVAFLLAAGYLPIPVSNHLQPEDSSAPAPLSRWLDAVQPAAIVLSGGNDVGSCRRRDLTELRLLDHARDRALPVLGICRGMQMMGVWAGATLAEVSGHVRTRHHTRGPIVQEVNSFHNQALASCPRDFEPLAFSEDGSLEAMKHQEWHWEGWMWHPEREQEFARTDLERLTKLFGR